MFLLYVFLTPLFLMLGTVVAVTVVGALLELCEQLRKDPK